MTEMRSAGTLGEVPASRRRRQVADGADPAWRELSRLAEADGPS
jgi:hypothetical protein